MSLIYEPRGKAREYSPLALNYFSGCPYGCRYCYVPQALFSTLEAHTESHDIKKSFSLPKLEKEVSQLDGSKPVFLSFTHDPYPPFDQQEGLTRQVLKVLLDYNIPVIILSKGGTIWNRDRDLFRLFGKRIKLGQSLTFATESECRKHEPHGADPQNRMKALRDMHGIGLMTWASMEPVINAEETLKAIVQSLPFVDEYRIGKISGTTPEYREIEKSTNWPGFVEQAISLIRPYGKRLYIKHELAALCPEGMLRPEETSLARFDSFCEARTTRTLFD